MGALGDQLVAGDFFRIPPDRVVDLGAEVEI
jgi:hypothetical protein